MVRRTKALLSAQPDPIGQDDNSATQPVYQDQQAPDQALQEQPTKVLIRAVHGTMVHPFLHTRIETHAITEMSEMDPWLKCQIQAGKLEVL